MSVPNATEDLSSEMEVDAFRRLFLLQYFEQHLAESIRPGGRPLREARDTKYISWLVYFTLISICNVASFVT
ncbi:unnamed protein product [Trifolium pratense]|uniref:Uncharacterized protein n=1 Tax=Trifolium pratense TaxID=57577 RepID=A0ACB0IEF7_TRIPR|nr:unnamed protein product [Trifolium pratense]